MKKIGVIILGIILVLTVFFVLNKKGKITLDNVDSPKSTSNGQRSGHGYAKITFLERQ